MIITRKFSGIDDVNAFLSGKITGGVLTLGGPELYLHGLTLIFTTPVQTITFAASPASAQVPLKLTDVISQIKSQSSNAIFARYSEGRIQIWTATPGTIVLAANGTANGLLGFSTTAATTGSVYNAPGGSAPAFVTLQPSPTNEDINILVTNE